MYAQMFERHKDLQCIEGENLFKTNKVLYPLGSGNSQVFLVENCITGERRAMKEIVISSFNDVNQLVKKEIQLLKKISMDNHPNLIQFFDSCILIQTQNEYATTILAYILMELAEFGSLDQFITKRHQEDKLGFDRDEVEQFMDQTIQALAFLQSINVAHCDIKPENILLSSVNPLQFKICDVGAGKNLTGNLTQSGLLTGTISFMSPEVLMHIQAQEINENPNFYVSDVFSLGLVLIYMCTFKKFRTEQRSQHLTETKLLEQQLLEMIHSKSQDDQIWGENHYVKEIILGMVQTDVTKRGDFLQLSKAWESKKDQIKVVNLLIFIINQKVYQIQINSQRNSPQIMGSRQTIQSALLEDVGLRTITTHFGLTGGGQKYNNKIKNRSKRQSTGIVINKIVTNNLGQAYIDNNQSLLNKSDMLIALNDQPIEKYRSNEQGINLKMKELPFLSNQSYNGQAKQKFKEKSISFEMQESGFNANVSQVYVDKFSSTKQTNQRQTIFPYKPPKQGNQRILVQLPKQSIVQDSISNLNQSQYDLSPIRTKPQGAKINMISLNPVNQTSHSQSPTKQNILAPIQVTRGKRLTDSQQYNDNQFRQNLSHISQQKGNGLGDYLQIKNINIFQQPLVRESPNKKYRLQKFLSFKEEFQI